MEQKTNDDFMRNILIEEAWKKLSSNFSWSETLLEKYQNCVDWNSISSNYNIQWTIPMITKFSKRINWSTFSECNNDTVLLPEVIEAFKHKWDWHELSGNPNVPSTMNFWKNMQICGIGTKLFVFGGILSMKTRVLTSMISSRSTSQLTNSKTQLYGTKWLSNR